MRICIDKVRKMKVKECTCYRDALSRFLDAKMKDLQVQIESEVKKVWGLHLLELQDQFLTNTNINKILKDKSGRFISAFLVLNRPIVIEEKDRVVLHVPTCSKLKPDGKGGWVVKKEEEFQIPISE